MTDLLDHYGAPIFRCECDTPERTRCLVIAHTGHSSLADYCDGCFELAEIDWNGETASVAKCVHQGTLDAVKASQALAHKARLEALSPERRDAAFDRYWAIHRAEILAEHRALWLAPATDKADRAAKDDHFAKCHKCNPAAGQLALFAASTGA